MSSYPTEKQVNAAKARAGDAKQRFQVAAKAADALIVARGLGLAGLSPGDVLVVPHGRTTRRCVIVSGHPGWGVDSLELRVKPILKSGGLGKPCDVQPFDFGRVEKTDERWDYDLGRAVPSTTEAP